MGWVQDIEYVVERQESHWTVSFRGEHCGRYDSRRQALGSAVRDAERVRALGHHVRVLAQRADGHLRLLPNAVRVHEPARPHSPQLRPYQPDETWQARSEAGH
jgi:hypothetical protein